MFLLTSYAKFSLLSVRNLQTAINIQKFGFGFEYERDIVYKQQFRCMK